MGQKMEPYRVALIVEDDFEVRGLAAALLEETDLKVVETSSAEEALDYLRKHSEEVAFLFADIRLPCLMDGLDLVRTVRLKWPWVRTVLTSGRPLEQQDVGPAELRQVIGDGTAGNAASDNDDAGLGGQFGHGG